MTILEVLPNLRAGGAENFVVNLANSFSRENKDISVSLLTLYPSSKDEFLRNKIDVNIKQLTLNKKKGLDLKLFFTLYKLIKSKKFDIVHFHVQSITYALLVAVFYRKARYYATIHSDAYKEASGIHRLVRKFMFLNKFMYPITISKVSQESFLKLYGVESSLIYNGVSINNKINKIDFSTYKKTNNTKIIINVASIIPLKNQIAFAKAINRLAKEGEDVVGLILGKKSQMQLDYYSTLKKEESSSFKILGEVDNPLDFMASGDFFALVSHYEGMPISLLEALSVDCVPIVTPVGGIVDIIKDGKNGIIAKDSTELEVYRALKSAILLDTETIEQMKENIRNTIKNYSISRCADLHLNLFKSK